jgi:hypothetical protein
MQENFIQQNKSIMSQVNRLGYNIIEVVSSVINPETQCVEPRVYYIHYFPPADNSTKEPQYDSIKSINSNDSRVRKETFIDFWLSQNEYQTNGNYKGGQWGPDNLPTLNPKWMTGVYVGDTLTIEHIANGIIPFNRRFGSAFQLDDANLIIPNSEKSCWSCNLHYNEKIYSGYVCNDPMPQKAIDVMVACVNENLQIFITILTRGLPKTNLDIPSLPNKFKYMPGGGEHKEPGKDLKIKSGIRRCMQEECGFDPNKLTNSYLLQIGKFNERGRDPRYDTYSWVQDGEVVHFGIERESETELSVFLLQSESGKLPKHMPHLDEIEIGSKSWKLIDDPEFVKPENKNMWMIPEHGTYLPIAKQRILDFMTLSIDERKEFLFGTDC